MNRGWSLLELFIAMAVMSILLAFSVPAYQAKLRKGRRIDATMALLNIEQEQEIYRNNHTEYGDIAHVWGSPTTTPKGYYQLSISTPTSFGYTVTAKAIKDQQNDVQDSVNCSTLTITVNKLTVVRSPSSCW